MHDITDSARLTRALLEQIPTGVSPAEREAILRGLVNKARQELEALREVPRAFIVALEHPRHGLFEIGVDPDGLIGTTGSLADIAMSLVTQAARQASSRTIDRDSFESEDDYLRALEKRTGVFQVISIRQAGDPIRWLVTGSDVGGAPFEEYVEAVTQEDAVFQARWKRASDRTSAILTIETAADVLGYFYDITISSAQPKPVSLEDLERASRALVDRIRAQNSDPNLIKSAEFAGLSQMLEKIETATRRAQFNPTDSTSAAIPAQPAPNAVEDTPAVPLLTAEAILPPPPDTAPEPSSIELPLDETVSVTAEPEEPQALGSNAYIELP